ncbi:DUF2239 family protein [Bordetella muralis]|jgi:uncharacterized protein|uniref:DUF2239 family protein n=1 Tax=Bordetella muralis TaxID=1649130 RepID=UPI0039EF6531
MNTVTNAVADTVATCTAFDGHRRIASGALPEVAIAVRRAHDAQATGPVLIYDDATGQIVDLDLRSSPVEFTTQGAAACPQAESSPVGAADIPAARGRGRPKLGVVSREITLLPRHWEWLAQQPGGTSVALRKLVDQARHADGGATQQRQQQEAAYRFMSSMAGNLPGFEEATRALFAHDQAQFMQHASTWPADVQEYATQMAFGVKAH